MDIGEVVDKVALLPSSGGLIMASFKLVAL
jgi:hypothetical protein